MANLNDLRDELILVQNQHNKSKMAESEVRTIPPVEERFKVNLVLIFDVVGDVIALLGANGVPSPVSSLILTFGKSYIEAQSAESLIKLFITKTSEHWEMIRLRNTVFLTEHITCVFSDDAGFAPHMQTINNLFKLIVNKEFDKLPTAQKQKLGEDMDDKICEIWDLASSCVRQCVLHIDKSRAPKLIVSESDGVETVKRSYTQNYYSGLSIKKLVDLWGVKLPDL